ncbi:ImmA/IrrE family metallo-endopeptidase [Arcanobacterium canis]
MTVDELIDKCARFGIDVFFIPLALAGVYWHEQSKIIIDSRMPPSHQLAVLAHEYAHALHCHEGCQAPDVEAWVDRKAARLLVSLLNMLSLSGCMRGIWWRWLVSLIYPCG